MYTDQFFLDRVQYSGLCQYDQPALCLHLQGFFGGGQQRSSRRQVKYFVQEWIFQVTMVETLSRIVEIINPEKFEKSDKKEKYGQKSRPQQEMTSFRTSIVIIVADFIY